MLMISHSVIFQGWYVTWEQSWHALGPKNSKIKYKPPVANLQSYETPFTPNDIILYFNLES